MPQPPLHHQLGAKPPRTRDDPLLGFLRQADGSDVDIDAAQVGRLDSLRLRTLLSAQAHWQASGLAFRLTGLTPPCRESLARLGVSATQFEPED